MTLRNSKTHDTDFHVRNGGTVFAFTPLTTAASEWIEENVQAESWQWLGRSLVVDHRYAEPLIRGILDSGLSIH
jgi:hypothetical protein